MKGEAKKLLRFMEGSSKRFVIPVYQRNYDWKLDNCRQLFDDLEKVAELDRKSHFFGSIVSYFNPDGDNEEYLIIDGQQRLTTVSLLLLAMYNLMEAGELKSEKSNLAEQIYNTFLVDQWTDGEHKIKLKPVKNDQIAFEKLFEETDEHISNSNLTVNYDFFCEKLRNTRYSVDRIYDSIKKLEIIDITLNGDDNPQLIFESLNSTGLALSEGDKIRNYVLMGQPVKLQEKYYVNYWNKIELNTGYGVSAFIRDYLSLKMNSIPVISKVYITFKAFVEKSDMTTEELLQDITNYSKYYHKIISARTGDNAIESVLYRLNWLDITVIRPFMMEVFRMQFNSILGPEDVLEILHIIESYIFRRMICDIPTNALNKIFATLARDIYRLEDNYDNFIEKLKYILCSKKDSGEYPDDQTFIENFSKKAIYKLNGRNRVYILERFENYDTDEDKDVYSHCSKGRYTIEHVMPQSLNADWKESLGTDYERIHEEWLHRIGNLTLTAYNSKYSNAKFTDKLNMEHGLRKSGIRLNTYFYTLTKWDESSIKKRTESLMKQALNIWRKPEFSYKPVEILPDRYTLADSEYTDLTGYKIEKYTLDDVDYDTKTWISMFVDALAYLYSKDPSILNSIAANSNDEYESLYNIFSTNKNTLIHGTYVAGNLFVESHINTDTKLLILRRLFDAYQLDTSDLSFHVRMDEVDADDIGDERMKYWTRLIPLLEETFADRGLWTKSKPGKYNNIGSSAFLVGFTLGCKVSDKQACVFFYLGRTMEENKKYFDMLFEHKADIESEMGVSLKWYRNDNKKHSRIEYVRDLPFKESNFEALFEFHTTWSRKMYDALKKYLLEK